MRLKQSDVLAAFATRFYQIARLAGAEAFSRNEAKDRWSQDYAKILKQTAIPRDIRLAHSKYFTEWQVGYAQAEKAKLTLSDVEIAVNETRAMIAYEGL